MKQEKPTYDEIMNEITSFEALAAELAKEGIHFVFHNHDAEFLTTYKGVPAYYLMAANSEHLKFELDVGWCTYAGCDPVRVIRELGDRLYALHIKDFAEGKVEQPLPNGGVNVMPRFTTPGTGKLDLAGCLKAGIEVGLDWAIVEQDFQYNLTQYETLTAAYLNMKETGYVE
jgi:sugar phosphate isomerase/epimerase